MKNKLTKKQIIRIAGSVAVLLVLYFAFELFMYVETDNAQVEAHTVMLAAKVPGFIVKSNLIEGLKVKKDDVLVEIDHREYQAALQSAESELLSLQARKKDAEKNYSRLRDLHNQNVVSSQQYDSAVAAYNEIKAKYDSADARLAQAKLNLENTYIKAPSDGVIAKKSAEIGQLAAPGVPLIGFVSSESRWVMANFKETDISSLHIGQKVDIKIDALSGKKYKGEIENISPATGATFTLLPPDNATGNFTKVVQRVPVRIKFNELSQNDIDRIQAGLSAIVKVHVH
ncbi:MAG: HlyD family secretion protein [Pseudobdellovibrio sp.]